MRWAVVVALGLGSALGCGEPAIELSLALPPAADVPEDYDLSCVTAIDVMAHAADDPFLDLGELATRERRTAECISVSGLDSFADVRRAMAGRFDVPIPAAGLLGIQVRGRAGTCDEQAPYHEAVFYGGAAYAEGATALTVRLAPNVSCNKTRALKVRPVDFLQLISTRTCAPVPDDQIYAGTIRPSMLAPKGPKLMFEYGEGVAGMAGGAGTLPSFSASDARSCVAALYVPFAVDLVGLGCLNPAMPTVCAQPGEVELAVVPYAMLSTAVDPALVTQFGAPVFLSIWNSATPRAPLVGASVTLADPERGKVVYLDANPQGITPQTRSQTGASGLVAVYTDRMMLVTIAGPTGTRKLVVGGTMDFPSTALVVMP